MKCAPNPSVTLKPIYWYRESINILAQSLQIMFISSLVRDHLSFKTILRCGRIIEVCTTAYRRGVRPWRQPLGWPCLIDHRATPAPDWSSSLGVPTATGFDSHHRPHYKKHGKECVKISYLISTNFNIIKTVFPCIWISIIKIRRSWDMLSL